MTNPIKFDESKHRCVWYATRPQLTIEHVGSRPAGRCVSESTYRIVSMWRLSVDQIRKLFDAGVIGCGQGMRILSQCDGAELPQVFDSEPAKAVDRWTGERVDTYDTPTHMGKPQGDTVFRFYTYTCEVTCDSGD